LGLLGFFCDFSHLYIIRKVFYILKIMLTKKKKDLYACDLNFFFSHKKSKFQEILRGIEKRTKKMSIFEKPKYFLEFFIFFERKKGT